MFKRKPKRVGQSGVYVQAKAYEAMLAAELRGTR